MLIYNQSRLVAERFIGSVSGRLGMLFQFDVEVEHFPALLNRARLGSYSRPKIPVIL